jgi:hypothetical protein
MAVKLPHSCSKCAVRWNGYDTAHCAACHETFTGISAFDAHRAGLHGRKRYCLLPDYIGLVDANRAYPCWGIPSAEEKWWKAT